MTEKPKANQPTLYEIKIQGRLDKSWSDWFEPLTIIHSADGDTILKGPLTDQAALQGVLINLSNLNLALISVNSTRESERHHLI